MRSAFNDAAHQDGAQDNDASRPDVLQQYEDPEGGLAATRSSLDLEATPSSLDLSGAEITETSKDSTALRQSRDAPAIFLPNQAAQYVTHIALDIGGSLVKLIYFSPDNPASEVQLMHSQKIGGKLHFVKFETGNVDQALEFIEAKGLHRYWRSEGPCGMMRVKATGGGAYKYAEVFRKRLGLILEKEDEMECLVNGCNFLCRAIRHEAFTYESGQTSFVVANGDDELFPYLLVNIGSGCSMVMVEREGEYTRISGSSLGGGTFWGLCKLLTGCSNFDEILEMCAVGDNAMVDMLVGDIYGGRDYSHIGLSANTIASSFGKVIGSGNELNDYKPADMAVACLRMISYNIGQLAYLNAKRYGLKRIFFGGFFIRGHPYTMETISFAIRFWSKGEMAAMFLRHEGFLGAVGAFLKVHPMAPEQQVQNPGKVRARFVERWSMGAPYSGGEVHGPAIKGVNEKVDWVEKFVEIGSAAAEAARDEHDKAKQSGWDIPRSPRAVATSLTFDPADLSKLQLHVGILHYNPSHEIFPLLLAPEQYECNTVDVTSRPEEMKYWCGVLADQINAVAEKAIASEQGCPEAKRRASAFARAFAAHLHKLQADSGAYGALGLAELFELREECLREFGFSDIYRRDKARENAAALAVLPDLIRELEGMEGRARLMALVEGVLAANIFDWGARACVELYHNGTILEIYREARTKLCKRPWRIDNFDDFADRWFAKDPEAQHTTGPCRCAYRRVMMFVDNAGADVVLGMIPFARELLRCGSDVILVANTQPAINDITHEEMTVLMKQVAQLDPFLKCALEAGEAAMAGAGGRVPPLLGLPCRTPSHDRLNLLHLSGHPRSPSATSPLSKSTSPVSPHATRPLLSPSNSHPPSPSHSPSKSTSPRPIPVIRRPFFSPPQAPPEPSIAEEDTHTEIESPGSSPTVHQLQAFGSPCGSSLQSLRPCLPVAQPATNGPRLFLVGSGSGSPCLDLRRVSDGVADGTVGADLVVIEGMGRAIHTNYTTRLKCDCLKLAMIKNKHLARTLFNGDTYDCVCRFDRAE